MIPVRNSYWLAENLPNASLLAYPDAGMALCSNIGLSRNTRPPSLSSDPNSQSF